MDKYLSVITNFGCHYTCPYCVVRENNLHIPKTTLVGLSKLRSEIKNNNCNWVSVSGGGDPLFDISEHSVWYDKFFSCIPYGVKTELHTSLNNLYNGALWHHTSWNRIVYHLNSYQQICSIKRRGLETVRVVFVVTDNFTNNLIDMITQAVKENPDIDELSFRQMVDSDYNTTHYCQEYLENGHQKDWWYIKQSDYNLYYAENTVVTKYADFKTSN